MTDENNTNEDINPSSGSNDDMPADPFLDNPNMTEEQRLAANKYLQGYREALDSEFRNAAGSAGSSEEAFESALDSFKKNVPSAAAQVLWLMENSTADSVRLASAKYIMDCVRKGMVDDATDPVSKILQELTKKKSPKKEEAEMLADNDTSD